MPTVYSKVTRYLRTQANGLFSPLTGLNFEYLQYNYYKRNLKGTAQRLKRLAYIAFVRSGREYGSIMVPARYSEDMLFREELGLGLGLGIGLELEIGLRLMLGSGLVCGSDVHETFQAETEMRPETQRSETETRLRCRAFCSRRDRDETFWIRYKTETETLQLPRP